MLKQRFVLQFGSQFGTRILGILAGLIVARVAGPEVVGVLAFGTAYISIWGFITGLFGTGHIKLISEGKHLGNCLTTYAWLQLASILVFLLVLSGILSYQKFFLDHYFESTTQEYVIYILLAANVIDHVLNFGNITFTAKLEQAKANFPLVVKLVFFHGVRVLIVFLGFKAIGLATVNLISSLLALPLAWRLLQRLKFGKFDRKLFKEHLHYALPIFLIVVVNSIMEYSDKLLLAYYSNTTELGYYSAAFSIGGVFLLISNSVSWVFFPLFSSLIANEDWAAVNQKIRSFQNFVAIFIFPMVCCLVIIGTPFIITLIGDKYQPSIIPFKILLLATYVAILGMPYGEIINGMGRFYLNVVINLICLAVFVISIFFLLNPDYLGLGAVGIAINLLIINLARNILYLIISFRIGKITLNRGIVLPNVLVLVLTLIFMYYEPTLNGWWAWWWLAFGPVFVAMVYFLFYLLGFTICWIY